MGTIMAWLGTVFPSIKCPHTFVRGVYGDEITYMSHGRRLCCVECGRYVVGDLEQATI